MVAPAEPAGCGHGDVFGAASGPSGQFLRAAAIDAGYELGVFEALAASRTLDALSDAIEIGRGRWRLRALLDVLVALGALARDGEWFARANVPPRPALPGPRAGWALMAGVFRNDQPLPIEEGGERRLHGHLAGAGAAAARELAPLLGSSSLLDLGGGAGAYTAAFLDARPGGRATLVDYPDVIALAREHLARFGDRVRFIASDIRAADAGELHGAVLLANVLHHHGPRACAELCAAAARAVAPGGVLVVKDLRMDEGRAGPIEGLLFALNMAIYTAEGDVYEASQIAAWLEDAGLAPIEERRLETAPDAFAIVGRKPRGALARFHDATGLGDVSAIERELDAKAATASAELPRPLRAMLAHAIALDPEGGAQLVEHYTERMPQQRTRQMAGAPGHELMHVALAWDELPRLRAAIDRLFAVLARSGVDPSVPLGAPTAAAFRARTPTLAALHARGHYGGVAQLLYGDEADLAYFTRRGMSPLATIDRYLVAPVIHELCHFDRQRDALPPHLDEAIGGWLGVHVWPELAYPLPDEDDALYAAPWLAQIGQAFARAFGIDAIVRGQTGAAPWDAVLPPSFVDTLSRHYWEDWCRRRSLHLLCDTADPRPWVELALATPLDATGGSAPRPTGKAGRAPTPRRLASLVDEDAAFDLAIVADGLRAMCLETVHVEGRVRVRTRLPAAPIIIDAQAGSVVRAASTPGYWIPAPVAARLRARGLCGYELRLASLSALPDAAAAICAASPGLETAGLALIPRVVP